MKLPYKSLFFFGLLALLMARVGFAETAAVTAYEIKDFRFGRYAKQGYERLVLELVEKEKTLAPAPSVKVNPNSAHSDVMVNISPAVLTGAIPESLINEAFSKKSKLLGSLSVNTDNSAGTVSLKATLKDPKSAVEAFWLNNPPRIVVDAISASGKKGRGVATHEDSNSGSSEAPSKKWRAGDFICFPSGAQAKLSVVFKARTGTSDYSPIPVPMPSTPAPQEAIVCYPKNTQVTAALSFAMPEEEHAFGQQHSANQYGGESEHASVPQVKAPEPTPLPTPSPTASTGASRNVSANESKKSANSISLLPPLR